MDEKTETQEPQQAATEKVDESPHGETPAIDWQAKYEEAVKQSRKWESRAKENSGKAKQVDEANGELADLRDRMAALEKENATKGVQLIKAKVSSETGVPAALLTGEDEESIRATADAISAFAASAKPAYPADKGGAGGESRMTKEAILKTKNPRERRQLIADNIDLF